MPDDYLTELPSYLHPLLEASPGGNAKLLAAWDGLNVETQIQILDWMDKHEGRVYGATSIRKKALDAPNAYVRYLAAKRLYSNNEVAPRIKGDEDPLIRYLPQSSAVRELEPEAFFDLPQDARLAYAREGMLGGESFASLMKNAIDRQGENPVASEEELSEIMVEYVRSPWFREEYFTNQLMPSFDYYSDKKKEDDIGALWGLVKALPDNLGALLIDGLRPLRHFDVISGPSSEFLLSLPSPALFRVLWRGDNILTELRKAIFWGEAGQFDDYIVNAAVSRNLDLTLEEFGKILAMPEEGRFTKIDKLTNAFDLRLAICEAICDQIEAHEAVIPSPLHWPATSILLDRARYRLSKLQGERKQEELQELGLYILATRISPPGTNKSKGLDLSDHVYWRQRAQDDGYAEILCRIWDFQKPKDTWSTFIELEKNWRNSSLWGWSKRKKERLQKDLPSSSRIYEESDLLGRQDAKDEILQMRFDEIDKNFREFL